MRSGWSEITANKKQGSGCVVPGACLASDVDGLGFGFSITKLPGSKVTRTCLRLHGRRQVLLLIFMHFGGPQALSDNLPNYQIFLCITMPN